MLKERILEAVASLPNGVRGDASLHSIRMFLEKPIFDELHARYLPFFKQWYASYDIPAYDTASNTIFIYETRLHYNLEFLIYNTLYFAPTFGLHLVCSSENHAYLCKILGKNLGRVKLVVLEETAGAYETGRNAYNEFMKSADFWNSIPSRIQCILTAEVDSYMRNPLEDVMLDIDYCASRWTWKPDLPGGGGISLRNVQAMKDICEKLPDLAKEQWAQDCWANEGVIRLGKTFNNTFFIESWLQPEAVGVHQWWTFCLPLTQERLDCLESYLHLNISKSPTRP